MEQRGYITNKGAATDQTTSSGDFKQPEDPKIHLDLDKSKMYTWMMKGSPLHRNVCLSILQFRKPK